MKSVTTCDICGDTLTMSHNTPYQFYRGKKGHKHCLKTLEQSDIVNEIVSPLKEQEKADVERSLRL